MDKAEFKKKYDELLIEFNKKYSERAKKKFRELTSDKLTSDIRNNNQKNTNEIIVDLIADMSEINKDYSDQLIGFMIEKFMINTDKEK